MEKIDFIVTWVDSTDPEWIKTYNHYRPEKPITEEITRPHTTLSLAKRSLATAMQLYSNVLK